MRLLTTDARGTPTASRDYFHSDTIGLPKRPTKTEPTSPVRWAWLTESERCALLRILADHRAQAGWTLTPTTVGLPRSMLETLVQLDWLAVVQPYQFEDQTRTSRAGYIVRPIAWAQAIKDHLVSD